MRSSSLPRNSFTVCSKLSERSNALPPRSAHGPPHTPPAGDSSLRKRLLSDDCSAGRKSAQIRESSPSAPRSSRWSAAPNGARVSTMGTALIPPHMQPRKAST